jgi:hypothetical protein
MNLDNNNYSATHSNLTQSERDEEEIEQKQRNSELPQLTQLDRDRH